LNDKEFDKMAQMTHEGASKITSSHHLPGESDYLTNTSEVYRYFDRLDVKEFRIYENQYGVSRFQMRSPAWHRLVEDRLNGAGEAEAQGCSRD
jgi:hypothetical protein